MPVRAATIARPRVGRGRCIDPGGSIFDWRRFTINAGESCSGGQISNIGPSFKRRRDETG